MPITDLNKPMIDSTGWGGDVNDNFIDMENFAKGSEAGDLFLLNLFLFPKGKNVFGVGPSVTLPTATDDLLGSDQWSVGPTFLWISRAVPKRVVGVLAYNQTSVAGDDDRDDVNVLTVQPIWVRNFKWGYLGWTDIPITVDWEHDNRFVAPVGVRIGKVLGGKTPWNLAVQPYWQFREGCCGMGDNDTWGIKVQATAILPNFLKH